MSGLMNLKKAKDLMDKNNLDCLLLSSYEHVFYASEFRCFDKLIAKGTEVYLIVPRDDSPTHLIAPHANRFITVDFPISAEKAKWYGSFYVKDGWTSEHFDTSYAALGKAMKELHLEKANIGIEEESLPAIHFARLHKQFPDSKLVDASQIMRDLRIIKSDEEIRRLNKACEVTELALEATMEEARIGMSELDLERIFSSEVARNYCHSFYVQVGSGGRGAYGGGTFPTEKRVSRGEVVRMDVSVEYEGYLSDLCRNFVFGHASEEAKKLYKATSEAVTAAIQLVKPGIEVAELFKAAVDVPRKAGYLDFQRHHVGHGIGLEAHEPPILGSMSQLKLEEGMTLCVEAPYYVFGTGGFAPEEMLYVTKDGYKLLSTPKEKLEEI